VQRVPALVWRNVYNDYLRICNDESSGQPQRITKLGARTLQDALRSCLDADTGVADPKATSKVKPQDEDVLQKLRVSDGHARRNMISFRENLLAAGSVSVAADKSDTEGETGSTAGSARGVLLGRRSQSSGGSVILDVDGNEPHEFQPAASSRGSSGKK
jgi:hypothetical protein